jgi:GNAT superfamily N-acetyltransferase
VSALAYRPAVAADRAFIVDSWVESFRHAHAAGQIPMPHYQDVYRAAANWFLDQPGCEATVADMGGMLAGWVAVQHDARLMEHVRKRVDGELKWVDELAPAGCPLVLYVYTKDAFRRHGIARGLFAAARIDLTGRFLYAAKNATSDRLRHLAPMARWEPLAARFPHPRPQPLEK